MKFFLNILMKKHKHPGNMHFFVHVKIVFLTLENLDDDIASGHLWRHHIFIIKGVFTPNKAQKSQEVFALLFKDTRLRAF